MKTKKLMGIITGGLLALSIVGCTTAITENDTTTSTQQSSNTTTVVSNESLSSSEGATLTSSVEGSMLDTADMFTDRDLEQSPDLSDATYLGLESGTDYLIEDEGVYVISGDVSDTTIIVEADDEAKVQLLLDGVNIVNEDSPAIYVKSGDKVYVTTTDSDNYLGVSGNYEADGDTNLDAVIFSKSDLVLNGIGTLEVVSAQGNGITSKDDLKITGGTLTVTAEEDGLEANDSVRIYDGDITIVSNKDAIHSENDEDSTLGYIYIENGILNITAADDGIRANTVVQIDGGTINIETSTEGIEGTYIQLNGGTISVYATDDGINATGKSDAYDIVIEVNGGDIDVEVSSGDTDAFDSNGDIYIYGGIIDITASSTFDTNGGAIEFTGGDITVNGEVITEITSSEKSGGGSHKR